MVAPRVTPRVVHILWLFFIRNDLTTMNSLWIFFLYSNGCCGMLFVQREYNTSCHHVNDAAEICEYGTETAIIILKHLLWICVLTGVFVARLKLILINTLMCVSVSFLMVSQEFAFISFQKSNVKIALALRYKKRTTCFLAYIPSTWQCLLLAQQLGCRHAFNVIFLLSVLSHICNGFKISIRLLFCYESPKWKQNPYTDTVSLIKEK